MSGNRQVLCVGFLLLSLYLGVAPSETASVPTPPSPPQLVASPDKEALSPEQHPPPPPLEKGELPEGSAVPKIPVLASEVGDMLKDPYHNFTVSTSDRDEGVVIDSETDTVDGPRVTHNNKTHEEEEDTSPTETIANQAVTSTVLSAESSTNEESSSTVNSTVLSAESSTNEESSSTVNSTASSVESSTTEEKSRAVSSTRAPIETSTADEETETVETKDEGTADWQPPPSLGSTEGEATTMKLNTPDEGVTSPPVLALVSQHYTHDHPTIGKASSLNHTTQVAAILAGVLVLMALAGYVGLLLWRRLLEKRYGNREMLVNEDDDFRHFEL